MVDHDPFLQIHDYVDTNSSSYPQHINYFDAKNVIENLIPGTCVSFLGLR